MLQRMIFITCATLLPAIVFAEPPAKAPTSFKLDDDQISCELVTVTGEGECYNNLYYECKNGKKLYNLTVVYQEDKKSYENLPQCCYVTTDIGAEKLYQGCKDEDAEFANKVAEEMPHPTINAKNE